ncbi:hypothetical protein WJX77_011014 [Trebouxia sp. C0004]
MRRAQANGVALPMLCAQPKQRHSAGSSTSFSFRSHEMALRKRDAALMLLSNDRRDAWQLSGLPLLPNVPVTKHTTAVQKLMVEVLSYTAQEHVFLCKDDYRQGPGALKPKGKAGCATRCVAFDVSAAQLAQSVSGHSDGKVTVHHFLKVLSTDDCNIMLNAPAGYGKTHLARQHWLWAQGLTPSIAWRVGRGHGSAEKMIVIEDFSMLSASFFELLEEVACRTKGSSLPFGGVRLMLVGDVAQLLPVGDFTVELGDDGEQEVHRRAPRQDPQDLGYLVDAEQVKDDMIHVAPQAMWPQVEFEGANGSPVLVTVGLSRLTCKTTWA